MKQLTREQAIALYEGGEWRDWTPDEIVRVQLYQDRLCVPFDVFRRSLTHVFGRPVYRHEFASANADNLIREYEGKCRAPTVEEIMALLPQDKLFIINAPPAPGGLGDE